MGGDSPAEQTPPAEPTMQETPLTLEAIAAGTITLTNPWSTLKYKKNGGDFVNVTASANTIAVAAGDKVAFYADGSENTSAITLRISCSSDCSVYGNVMSLLSSSDFKNATSISTEYAFAELFYYSDDSANIYTNTHIKNHAQKALVLPATTLAANCYNCMFRGCEGLTSAPALPARTLVASCYYGMFSGCTSLSSVTCLATDISAEYCTVNWLNNVASSGTFTKAKSMTIIASNASGTGWRRNSLGIPSSWTVEDYQEQ